jgi:hypothetical protein
MPESPLDPVGSGSLLGSSGDDVTGGVSDVLGTGSDVLGSRRIDGGSLVRATEDGDEDPLGFGTATCALRGAVDVGCVAPPDVEPGLGFDVLVTAGGVAGTKVSGAW